MTRFRLLFAVICGIVVSGPAMASDDGIERLGEGAFTVARYVVMQAEIDVLKARVAELQAKNDELQPGRGGPGSDLRYFGPYKRPLDLEWDNTRRNGPQALDNTRGTVTAYEKELVVISIGLDAGVAPGSVLELSRLDSGGKYLGTLTVTDAYKKTAVARFTPPAGGKPLARLKAEDLPRVGDRVTKPAVLKPR